MTFGLIENARNPLVSVSTGVFYLFLLQNSGYEFDVITGVILGGASLAGGSGSIIKTLIGVIIIGILKNGFVLIGLPYYLQWLAQCLIILTAVWFSIRSKNRRTA